MRTILFKVKRSVCYPNKKDFETYPIYFEGWSYGQGNYKDSRITEDRFNELLSLHTYKIIRDDETTLVYEKMGTAEVNNSPSLAGFAADFGGPDGLHQELTSG